MNLKNVKEITSSAVREKSQYHFYVSVFFWVLLPTDPAAVQGCKTQFLRLKKAGLQESVFKARLAGIYSAKATTALKLLSTA